MTEGTQIIPRDGELYNPLDLLYVANFLEVKPDDLFSGEQNQKLKYLIDWAQMQSGKNDANSILLTLQKLQTEIGGKVDLHKLYESARIRGMNAPLKDLSQLEEAFQAIKQKVKEIKQLHPQLKQLKHFMRYL